MKISIITSLAFAFVSAIPTRLIHSYHLLVPWPRLRPLLSHSQSNGPLPRESPALSQMVVPSITTDAATPATCNINEQSQMDCVKAKVGFSNYANIAVTLQALTQSTRISLPKLIAVFTR